MKIVVLNDGETFSSANGCLVVDVPDNIDVDEIENFLKELPEDNIIAEIREDGIEVRV